MGSQTSNSVGSDKTGTVGTLGSQSNSVGSEKTMRSQSLNTVINTSVGSEKTTGSQSEAQGQAAKL